MLPVGLVSRRWWPSQYLTTKPPTVGQKRRKKKKKTDQNQNNHPQLVKKERERKQTKTKTKPPTVGKKERTRKQTNIKTTTHQQNHPAASEKTNHTHRVHPMSNVHCFIVQYSTADPPYSCSSLPNFSRFLDF